MAYSHFIGFEKPSLAARFPRDTLAFAEIRHLRKAGIALATDPELKAANEVISGAARILLGSRPKQAPGVKKPQPDFRSLSKILKEIKTRVAVACFAPTQAGQLPSLAIATYYKGSEKHIQDAMLELSRSLSSNEETLVFTNSRHHGRLVHSLEIPKGALGTPWPSFKPSWTLNKGVLFMASDAQTLSRILSVAGQTEESNTLESLSTPHARAHFVPTADIELLVNAPEALGYLAAAAKAALQDKGALWKSFSAEAFLEELGLSEARSLLFSLELGGSQTAFASLRCKVGSKLPSNDLFLIEEGSSAPVASVESLSVDIGELIERLRRAGIAGAPLAAIPYALARSRVMIESGIDLERALAAGFQPGLVLEQSLESQDQGSGARLVVDHAVKLRLSPESKVPELWDYLQRQILKRSDLAVEINNKASYFALPGEGAAQSDKIAVAIDKQFLVLGYGSLNSFETLRRRAGYFLAGDPQAASQDPPGAVQVGSGRLRLQALPPLLFHAAETLHQLRNPGAPLPAELLEFDWTRLSILEQTRESKTVWSESGQIYRISRRAEKAYRP